MMDDGEKLEIDAKVEASNYQVPTTKGGSGQS
jgi:hypothetical protein